MYFPKKNWKNMMKEVRRPAVAGMFYPGDKNELKNTVELLLNNAETNISYNNICGIVSPHAGYPYSGLSAAYSYNAIKNYDFETAIILSPSHREYFRGLSLYPGRAYETPLGSVEIDHQLQNKLLNVNDLFVESEKGHGAEHAVEVQLPFLQTIKDNLKILPVIIGDQSAPFIEKLTEGLKEIADSKIVIIVSSDLSHFHPREIADKIDSQVESHILKMDPAGLQNDLTNNNCEACGGGGIVALLKLAEQLNYNNADVLSRTDSGDATGDYSSVVGYLSAIIYN